MPSQHKYPPLRFRPPEAERQWLLERAAATGRPMNAVLTEAVRALMAADLCDRAQGESRDDGPSATCVVIGND